MAIVSFSNEFIFVKTRKTGGTSVQKSLLPALTGKDVMTEKWLDVRSGSRCIIQEFASIEEIHSAFPKSSRFYTFGFTRNPYSITLSRYLYQLKMGRIGGPMSPQDFNRWARDVYFVGEPRFPNGRFILDRSRYLLFDQALNPKVHWIGRLERLERDFELLTATLGLRQVRLLHVNKSNSDNHHPIEWMNQETRRLVEYHFDFELEYFGYQFPTK